MKRLRVRYQCVYTLYRAQKGRKYRFADHRYLCRTSGFKQRHVTDELNGVAVSLLRQEQQGFAIQVLTVPLREGQLPVFPKHFRSRFVVAPAFRITPVGQKKHPQVETGFGKIRFQFERTAIVDLRLLIPMKSFKRARAVIPDFSRVRHPFQRSAIVRFGFAGTARPAAIDSPGCCGPSHCDRPFQAAYGTRVPPSQGRPAARPAMLTRQADGPCIHGRRGFPGSWGCLVRTRRWRAY